MSYQVSKQPVPTNHILHLILTLISCGLWAPVWLLVAIINANTDRTTTTQTYGVQPVQPIAQFPSIPAYSSAANVAQPPPCPDHVADGNRLDCPPCGAVRRGFYQRLAEG
jgi:hypothetical protein